MIEVFLFIFRYKIKKNGENLSLHCREFFSLSKKSQKKVLDLYFKNIDDNLEIDTYFNRKDARYYDDNKEITFFSSYYFCKKILDFNVKNLGLVDKFDIALDKKNYLIDYTLELIKDRGLKVRIDDFLVYPNNLPDSLAKNINFMRYITSIDKYNIKYIVYNENCPEAQRQLIKNIIKKLNEEEFKIEKFFLNDKKMPKLLSSNIDFIVYMIEHDLSNIKYLSDKVMNSFTVLDRRKIIDAIIKYGDSYEIDVKKMFDNHALNYYLSRDLVFINYIVNKDVDNIKYVDWHNIVNSDIKKIIDALALKLVRDKNMNFNCEQYPFYKILRQNYMFMAYLIDRDRKYINKIEIVNKDEVNKIIDIYLNKYRKCTFKKEDYFDDSGYVVNNLVENKYMLSYLIRHDNKIFKYIDFLTLSNAKDVVEVMLKEMEKKDFSFDNDCFLRNGKYPIVLSNSYRFMRYVIDKNFNNLAYIDISLIDDKDLKRIINYAFRMVYYIRGNNKKLNFDLEGYFKDSLIFKNDYFQECLKSL